MGELQVGIIGTDEEQRTILQLMVDGLGVARVTQSCSSFPIGAADPTFRRLQAASPQVILVDMPAASPASALETIELLHAETPDIAVFAIGDTKQPQVIISAMRAGAREFLERPVGANQLLEAFTRYLGNRRKATTNGTRGKIFSLLNAKGGNGATTIAVNTALALAARNTVLVDLAPMGNAALQLNVKPTFTVLDALRNLHRLDSALLDGFITRHDSGLHLLAGNPEPVGFEAQPGDIARLFDFLVSQYRYIVVDLSTRLDQVARAVCQLADLPLIVVHADVPSLWSACQIGQGMLDTGHERFKLVLNRYRKVSGFSDRDVESATHSKILWKIPNHYAAFSGAIDRGSPVVHQNHSELARGFVQFASVLTGEKTQAAAVNRRRFWPE